MKSHLPPPRTSRERSKDFTPPPPISQETPGRVKDILATTQQTTSRIKRKPFYPLWETKK